MPAETGSVRVFDEHVIGAALTPLEGVHSGDEVLHQGLDRGEPVGAFAAVKMAVVTLAALVVEADDPVLGQFLGFLAHDIATHPERLQSVSHSFVQRVQSLVGEVKVDLDAPLSEDDE